MLRQRCAIMRKWRQNRRKDARVKAAQTAPKGVREYDDIFYAGTRSRLQRLDVYLPINAPAALPVIFDIHGGGWAYGDKELNKYYCMSLAARGFAVVNISYRLAPRCGIGAQIQDIFAAFGWLAEHGAHYGCDTGRVCLTGDSAGGHLATLAAIVCGSTRLQRLYKVEPPPFALRALAVTSGLFELEPLKVGPHPLQLEMGRFLLGAAPARSPFYAAFSIPDVLDEGLPLPPLLLVSFTGDALYHAQTLAFAALLSERGIPHTLRCVGADWAQPPGHVYTVGSWDQPPAMALNDELADFFAAAAADTL